MRRVGRADNGDAEVDELDPRLVEDELAGQQRLYGSATDVVRLEVAMHDALAMHVADRLRHLSGQRAESRDSARLLSPEYESDGLNESAGALCRDVAQVALPRLHDLTKSAKTLS